MDISLERPKQQKLAHEEIDNLQSPLSIKAMEFIVKNFPTKETLGSNDFASELYQTFKEKITPICYGLNCVFLKIYILKS